MDEDEAAEIDRLRAEVAGLRAENAELRTVVEQLEGVEVALRHLLDEAMGTARVRRRRDQVQLLGEPSAGSA